MGWGDRAKAVPAPPMPSSGLMEVTDISKEAELKMEINWLTDYCLKYARGKGSLKVAQEANRIRTKYGFEKQYFE